MDILKVLFPYSIGQTTKGKQLAVIQLGGHKGEHQTGIPDVKFTAGFQGGNRLGPELLIQLAKYLCTNYHRDMFVSGVSHVLYKSMLLHNY